MNLCCKKVELTVSAKTNSSWAYSYLLFFHGKCSIKTNKPTLLVSYRNVREF